MGNRLLYKPYLPGRDCRIPEGCGDILTGHYVFRQQLKKPPDFSGGFFLVFLLLFVTAATGDIFAADQMTIAAVGFNYFMTDINRVHEVLRLAPCRNILLRLIQDGMTDLAILRNHLAARSFVLVIVATEAARRVEVTQIARIRAPVDL